MWCPAKNFRSAAKTLAELSAASIGCLSVATGVPLGDGVAADEYPILVGPRPRSDL